VRRKAGVVCSTAFSACGCAKSRRRGLAKYCPGIYAESAATDADRVRDGDTIDFLLRAKRDQAAARRFLDQAMALHGEPDKITIDQSGANTAAIQSYNAEHDSDIELRQCKYLNNIVGQDHRQSNGSFGQCLGSRSFAAHASSLPALR
jgi:transposase-like protein